MITALNISLSIHGRALLQSVNFEVRPGSFTALAGPNGAGKSSLLKILSNESDKFVGHVEINGRSIRKYDVAELSKVRAVLPQESSLQFPFTVRQIVALSTQFHHNANEKNKRIIDEVMELTGVISWCNRNYLTLSGGERQRVQLARVLSQVWDIRDYPRFVLLDEPTSSLDLMQQQMIFRLVRQACERNIGVLAIVHDLNQIVPFADTLYFLRDGKILTHGKTRDVFTKVNIEKTYCCHVNVYHDPCTDCPFVIPDNSFQSQQTLQRT